MKRITLLLCFISCFAISKGQVLFVEDFNCPIGSDIKSQGWPIHSGSGPTKDSILVVEGLTFDKYIGSDIGGAAAVTGRYCDHNHTFASQTSGTTYAAFLMKAQAAGSSASYFLHFGPTNIGTTFISRVWINSTATGLGLGDSAPTSFASINPGQTYLIVLKYDFATKTSSLYIFDTFPAAEPTTPQTTYIESKGPAAASNPTDLGSIALRQSQASSVAQQNVIVDAIRISTSWASLFTTAGINPTSEGILYVTLIGNKLTIPNTTSTKAEIFNMLGAKVQDIELVNGSANLNLNKGLYIVRAGNKSAKISL